MQVIPAINVQTFEDAASQIKQAAEFSEWIHLDITDGVFSPAKIWGSPEELLELRSKNYELGKLNFEVHLMVQHPEAVIEDWLKISAVKRVIVHVESISGLRKTAGLAKTDILAKCKEYGAQVMLAANPETPADGFLKHKDDFKYFQLLGVKAGWAGQKFNPAVIDKIKFLKNQAPGAIIEVDGGINPETARMVKEAEADIVVSASYIFGSRDPKKAYEDLRIATNLERMAANHESSEEKILFKELSYKLQGIFYEVRNQYGQHHKEKIYHNALKEKFDEYGLKYVSEPRIDVRSISSNKKLGTYVPDFLIEDLIIVEIKAASMTTKDMEMQLIEYLKSSRYELAYLVNFGERNFKSRRYIYTKDKKDVIINNS